VLTDAVVESAELHRNVKKMRADQSFQIASSVEGHTSTNDTALLPRQRRFGDKPAEPHKFAASVSEVCTDLARSIRRPTPKGPRHLITIEVEGLPSDEDARRVAKGDCRQPAGEDGHLRGRPELGPHRVRGLASPACHSRRQDVSLWAWAICRLY